MTPVLKFPTEGGNTLRIYNSILALRLVSEIHIVCLAPIEEIGGVDAVKKFRSLAASFCFGPSVRGKWKSRFLKLQLLFKHRGARPKTVDDWNALFIEYTATKMKIDVVWMGYGNISYPLLRKLKNSTSLRTVLDTDSVWSRYLGRSIENIEDPKEKKRLQQETENKEKEERWGTALSNITTAVSEVDAQYYRQLARDKSQVEIFPNAIDLNAYSMDYPAPIGWKQPSLYIAGSFFKKNCPMEDATRWFIREVIPYIRSPFHLYVVGRGSNELLSDIREPHCHFTGRVESVLPYLCNATVVLVPLRFESGTRFKILEAGACKKAVLSTSLGAEGLPLTHGKEILIADEPTEFASAIDQLLENENLRRELGNRLYERVASEFGLSELANRATQILDKLATTSEPQLRC